MAGKRGKEASARHQKEMAIRRRERKKTAREVERAANKQQREEKQRQARVEAARMEGDLCAVLLLHMRKKPQPLHRLEERAFGRFLDGDRSRYELPPDFLPQVYLKNTDTRKALILKKFIPNCGLTPSQAKTCWYLGFVDQYSFSKTSITVVFYKWFLEARLKLGQQLTTLESLYHMAILENASAELGPTTYEAREKFVKRWYEYRENNYPEDIYRLSMAQKEKWIARFQQSSSTDELANGNLEGLTSSMEDLIVWGKDSLAENLKEQEKAIAENFAAVEEAQHRSGLHLGALHQNEEDLAESEAIQLALRPYEGPATTDQGTGNAGEKNRQQRMSDHIEKYIRELEQADSSMESVANDASSTRTVTVDDLSFFDEDFVTLSKSSFTATVPMDTIFTHSSTITEQDMPDAQYEKTAAMMEKLSIDTNSMVSF